MLYELPEVCALLSLGMTKVKQLIYDGALPSVSIGTRRFVRDTDLRAYVDGLRPDYAPGECEGVVA